MKRAVISNHWREIEERDANGYTLCPGSTPHPSCVPMHQLPKREAFDPSLSVETREGSDPHEKVGTRVKNANTSQSHQQE